MLGKIPPPRRFADWIKSLVALKATWTTEDYARSWRAGAEMLQASGTTTVADVEAVPVLLPGAWADTRLRVISFREIIHLKAAEATEMVERAATELAEIATDALAEPQRPTGCSATAQASAFPSATWERGSLHAVPLGFAPPSYTSPFRPDQRLGLSPHAPYTTTRDLLRGSARVARANGWRLTTHVAESREEFEMFTQAKGALYEWLRPQRDMSDCGGITPVQHLHQLGYLGSDVLAVHVNYLGPDDAVALHTSQTHVVHCPRSHAYFGHATFPYDTLAGAGVNVCLGTDSLVTVRAAQSSGVRLDLFAEMRTFARRFPHVPTETILRMVTVNPAAALGITGAVGELRPGALADVIAIPYKGSAADAHDATVQHEGNVSASMIGGQWAVAPAQ
jgi:cytosine/adenosine deaminase-related metal-dependent hydrolase